MRSLNVRKAPPTPGSRVARQVPRIVAGVAAVIANLILVVALTSPSHGLGGAPRAPARPILVYLLSDTEPARRPVRSWEVRPYRAHLRVVLPHPMLEVPRESGPPTETAASIAGVLGPDLPAKVVAARELWEVCQRVYPEELGPVRAEPTTIVLRVYVMADGRIGQSAVTSSSGDPHLDFITMKCLQTYGHLEPARDDDLPTGSWQQLSWNWSNP